MKFFLDTANIDEIKDLVKTGFVDGITTNPTLIAKSGRKILDVIAEICDIVPGPVSAEVAATDYATMIKEGEKLASIAKHVVIKVPLTHDGLLACRYFSSKEIKVNVTLCFSAMQAMLAAKAGASFISPFIGRIDDTGHNGMQLIADIQTVYNNYGIETEILAASIRHSMHVLECALIGVDIATVPPSILKQLIQHPLTDKGVAAFVKDWQATNDSILS